MNKNNNHQKKSWRFWLVKKLLSEHIKKEELYSIISQFFEQEDLEKHNLNNHKEVNENDLMKNIINLHDKTVEDVMVPRAEIIAIKDSNTIEEVIETINKENHSRMPIFKKNLDDATGMIHVKDILANINEYNFSINSITREILYVAPSSSILELLKRMRNSKIHIGLVMDEHGGVDGLVTIEDLVEEIVGEIEDEHDAEDTIEKINKIGPNNYIVDSSLLLTELEQLMQINLPDSEKDEIDTVGGLVFFIAGKIPIMGENFTHKTGLNFKIVDASERRINKIRINKNKL